MKEGHATQIGKALAFAVGDLRDWPEACGWCESEDVHPDFDTDFLRCGGCGKLTSREVAFGRREGRARREVLGV